jgi:hypothetical protein
MPKDPIVEEVRKARQKHASKFGYDLKLIFEDLKKQEAKSKHKVCSFSPEVSKARPPKQSNNCVEDRL